jgi:thiol:disulfide interchange protein
LRKVFLALLLVLDAPPALAHHSALHFGGAAAELLEPEKAFRFSAQPRDGAVEVRFAIADGYYLYPGQVPLRRGGKSAGAPRRARAAPRRAA